MIQYDWGAVIEALDRALVEHAAAGAVGVLNTSPTGRLGLDALRGTLCEEGWRGDILTGATTVRSPRELWDRTRARLRAAPRSADFPAGPLPRLGVGWGTYRFKGDGGLAADALMLGAALIDTAPTYGYGRVEKALGPTLRTLGGTARGATWVATKIARNHLSRAAATNSLRRSQAALGRVDLIQVHWPSASIPIAETMGALAALVDAGEVAAIGVCNMSVDQVLSAQAALPWGHRIASVQVRYNPEDQEALPVVELAADAGIRLIAHSPLGQGSGALCAQPEDALRWLLRAGVLPIPATNNPRHLRANLGVRS